MKHFTDKSFYPRQCFPKTICKDIFFGVVKKIGYSPIMFVDMNRTFRIPIIYLMLWYMVLQKVSQQGVLFSEHQSIRVSFPSTLCHRCPLATSCRSWYPREPCKHFRVHHISWSCWCVRSMAAVSWVWPRKDSPCTYRPRLWEKKGQLYCYFFF